MSRFLNTKWVIITASEAENVDFSKVSTNSADTLRWSNDKTKTFVKFEGNAPDFLIDKNALTHTEILTELSKDEWSPPLPENLP